MDIIEHVRGVSTPDRIVPVNRQAKALFDRIGLTPPDSGAFDPKELDVRLAGLDASTRMLVKSHLRDAGLLSPGRPIDDARR